MHTYQFNGTKSNLLRCKITNITKYVVLTVQVDLCFYTIKVDFNVPRKQKFDIENEKKIVFFN